MKKLLVLGILLIASVSFAGGNLFFGTKKKATIYDYQKRSYTDVKKKSPRKYETYNYSTGV